jgi:hypothetical protein
VTTGYWGGGGFGSDPFEDFLARFFGGVPAFDVTEVRLQRSGRGAS